MSCVHGYIAFLLSLLSCCSVVPAALLLLVVLMSIAVPMFRYCGITGCPCYSPVPLSLLPRYYVDSDGLLFRFPIVLNILMYVLLINRGSSDPSTQPIS